MERKYIITLISFLMATSLMQAQWNSLNAPKANYETYQSLAVSDDGKNLFTYMSDISGKAFFVTSHDYGNTWQTYEQPKVNYSIPSAPIGTETIFWEGDVLYYVSSDMAFKKSIDFGQTFTVQNTQARSLDLPILRAIDGKWYVANAGYNWVSTDKGVSWTQTTGGIYGTAYVTANNGNIISTQNNGTIGYSTNNGINWSSPTVPSGLPSGSGSCISKATNGTLLWFKFSTPSSVLKSTDNGVSWQLVNATLPTNTKRMYFYGNDIIAHEILGTTYKSSDGGLTFSVANSTNLLTTVSSMLTNGKNIYYYGMSGIYRYGLLNTGFNELNSNNKLIAYPNPCRNNFSIQSIENYNSYRLTDLTGKVIIEHAAINHQIDISFLEAGIYLLTAIDKYGDTSQVKIVKE